MHGSQIHLLPNARMPLRRPLALFLLLVAALSQLATVNAQARFNYLEVDGHVLEGAGPYYFTGDGNRTAFADLHELSKATGWTVTVDAESQLVLIDNGETRARFAMTDDAGLGLQRSVTNLRVDGAPSLRAVPRIITTDTTMYVPLLAIVEAFGGDATWVPATRVIRVTTSQAGD